VSDSFCELEERRLSKGWNTTTGERVGSVGYEAHLGRESGRVRLKYVTTRWSGEQRESNYWIQLETTPQPFGGRRWWFVCPRTGRWPRNSTERHLHFRFASGLPAHLPLPTRNPLLLSLAPCFQVGRQARSGRWHWRLHSQTEVDALANLQPQATGNRGCRRDRRRPPGDFSLQVRPPLRPMTEARSMRSGPCRAPAVRSSGPGRMPHSHCRSLASQGDARLACEPRRHHSASPACCVNVRPTGKA
jgi:hypothetical protein